MVMVTFCLRLAFPQRDPDIKICMERLYLGGDFRQHQWERGESERKGEKTNTSCANEQLGLSSTGHCWEMVCDTLEIITPRVRKP